jgi:hypothetical protein
MQVALQYDSGIVVYVERSQMTDPLATYKEIVSQVGHSSYVTTIQGAPALVLLGNVSGHAPSIDTVIADIHVQMVGGIGTLSEADMLRVASTVGQG